MSLLEFGHHNEMCRRCVLIADQAGIFDMVNLLYIFGLQQFFL